MTNNPPSLPDFDQMARRLAEAGTESGIVDQEHVNAIAEQLHQIWNARGVADEDYCERLREIHAALLIDLRALVEQWNEAHMTGLSASDGLREQSAHESAAYERGKADARGFCSNALAARLSREPHHDQ